MYLIKHQNQNSYKKSVVAMGIVFMLFYIFVFSVFMLYDIFVFSVFMLYDIFVFLENILFNKPVTFSSQETSNSSCYKTSYQDYPWIQIDLLKQHHLHELMIDNYMESKHGYSCFKVILCTSFIAKDGLNSNIF